MSTQKIGIEAARPILGDLADQASKDGLVTVLARNGISIAAIVPLYAVPANLRQEPAPYDDATREDMTAGLARWILRQRKAQRVFSDAQLSARARSLARGFAIYGGAELSGDDLRRLAVDALHLADDKQDADINWQEWAR